MNRPLTRRRTEELAARLTHYRSWLACCLSRGRQAPLGEGDVAELVSEFGENAFAGGMFVLRQGDDAAQIHVVRSGIVELSKVVNGRRVTLQNLGPGDVFGDVAAFLGESEPFDARAVEDSVVLSLDAASLFRMLRTRPHVARRWIVSLAERMAGLQQRLSDLLAGGLDAQLASVLLRESANGPDIDLTQGRLADMLGSPRTSIQRVLKQLAEDGSIELGYGRITVRDRDRLANVAGGAEAGS